MRQVPDTLWLNRHDGIPGNDDLGQMSSWCVWTAMGMYPVIPGRAELLLTGPLFKRVHIERGERDIIIQAPAAATHVPYVQALTVDGVASPHSWLPESFVQNGGTLHYTLSGQPATQWGSASADLPPSFQP